MTNLLNAEFYKLLRSVAFRLLLMFVFVSGGLRGVTPVIRKIPLTGYEMFTMELKPDILYGALICIFVSSYFCDEFSNRTFYMSCLCGGRRRTVFLAKTITFFVALIPIVLLPIAVSTAVVTTVNGFGGTWSEKLIFDVISELFCYIFRSLSLGSFALLAASLVKDRIGAFGIGMAGIYLMMMTVINNLESPNTINLFIVVSLLEIVVILTAAVFVFERTDLK